MDGVEKVKWLGKGTARFERMAKKRLKGAHRRSSKVWRWEMVSICNLSIEPPDVSVIFGLVE